MQARGRNFTLSLVIPKSVFLEHLTHEMLLGRRILQSHKLGKSHIQLSPQVLAWRVERAC